MKRCVHRSMILLRALASVLLVGASVTGVRADLDSYLRRPEPAYHWEKQGETQVDGGTIYDLHLVSQTWQGIPWEHRLEVFRPTALRYPHFCALYNTGGDGSEGERAFGMQLARRSGALFAILYGIPKQPLFGGKTEDGLVVYTWAKYLETGDDTWPLHFPMAKAVLKAMDTVQALGKSERWPAVSEFMITGASKRGWTTWLAAASRDRRIKAIAPMVIDTLNVAKQLPHQLAAYGKPSEQIDDYSKAGMLQKLNTPGGQRLMALEDPYSYRDRLVLPKLIILGTNDRYWAQDALNLYWDDLIGPKYISYTPNSGHGLEDRPHVIATLAAFIHATAGKRFWPKMHWSYSPDSGTSPGGVDLTVTSDIAPVSAQLFHVSSETQDFRDSKWTSEPMTLAGKRASGHLAAPDSGYAATFGELSYEIDGMPFTLSTQIRILAHEK